MQEFLKGREIGYFSMAKSADLNPTEQTDQRSEKLLKEILVFLLYYFYFLFMSPSKIGVLSWLHFGLAWMYLCVVLNGVLTYLNKIYLSFLLKNSSTWCNLKSHICLFDERRLVAHTAEVVVLVDLLLQMASYELKSSSEWCHLEEFSAGSGDALMLGGIFHHWWYIFPAK